MTEFQHYIGQSLEANGMPYLFSIEFLWIEGVVEGGEEGK